MPFVSNMNDEEQKIDPSITPPGGVSPTGGGSAVRLAPSAAVAPGSSGGAGTPAAPKAGGQFASLQNYLSANQGQADPLASKITSGIGQQYNTLQGQNQSVLGDIGNQVSSNAVAPNANDILAQEAANPVSFASNASNIPSFQKLLNASYSGPASAESTDKYQSQQNAINQAIASGQNATKTEAGRENLLVQNEAKPTTGVTALNSAILSQSPTALNSVEQAYTPFSNLLTGLSSGAQGINTNIAKTQNDITAANTTANQQLAGQNTKLQNDINAAVAAAAPNATIYQNTVLSQDQASQKAIQDAITKFEQGLNSGPSTAAFPSTIWNNIGMGGFGTGPIINPNAPGLANVVTPDQLATAQALSTLGNTTNAYAGITPTAYNPFLSNPTIDQMASPVVNPLEKYMQDYFAAANQYGLMGNPPPGSEFGAGSNTEAMLLPQEAAVAQQQYQNLLNTLNIYLNAQQPAFPGIPQQLPGTGARHPN